MTCVKSFGRALIKYPGAELGEGRPRALLSFNTSTAYVLRKKVFVVGDSYKPESLLLRQDPSVCCFPAPRPADTTSGSSKYSVSKVTDGAAGISRVIAHFALACITGSNSLSYLLVLLLFFAHLG